MPGDPSTPEGTPNPAELAKPEANPAAEYEALKAEYAKTQEQLKQAVAAVAAMQADQAPKTAPPPEPEITPEFQTQAQAFFKRELAPFLQQIDQRFGQLMGWQGQQQAQQLNQEAEVPDAIQNEARALMQQYAQAGRPIAYETAVTHVVGNREIARMRQEAATKKAKATFNTAMLPAFSGSGGLPNLQPNGTPRPAANDIAGWASLANQNDLPL